MRERAIPEDLREMYAFAIAWRHEFGSERRYGAATVESLIERIADLTAENERLKAPVREEELAPVIEFIQPIGEDCGGWYVAADQIGGIIATRAKETQ